LYSPGHLSGMVTSSERSLSTIESVDCHCMIDMSNSASAHAGDYATVHNKHRDTLREKLIYVELQVCPNQAEFQPSPLTEIVR
jgi:hypothetical protein